MHLPLTTSVLLAAAISGTTAQQQIGGYTTGTLGNASVITNNPAGAAYIATLPATAFNKNAYPNGGNVQGSIQAVSSPDGRGVMFHVNFTNLPSTGGPFLYHIHDQPVPASGNCTQTLAHHDPYKRGETSACDPTIPETCQVGDLSGKHGKVELNGSATYLATYIDDFASTVDGIGAFFGNRSFVFHFGNTTRITCANFVAVRASSAACNGSSPTTVTGRPTATGFPSNSSTTSPPATVVTAAAYANSAKAMAAVGAAGLAFLL
ncbi:unnamed protein product [Discula destructiva]